MLAPVFLSYLMEAWRKKRGYVKRHRGEGSAHRFSKDKVFTHGDFYLLSLVGASLKATLGITDVRDADVVELRRVAKNLRLVNDEFGGAFQGSLRKLVRAIDLGFDSALSILYDYCNGLCQTDPGLDIRTILVRDATWGRISEQFGTKLGELLDVNRGLLTMEF